MAEDSKSTIRFFHGAESGIQAQIDAGKIDESDFVVTSDTDTLVYIDKDKNQHQLGNAKSKESHDVNLGVNGSVGGLKTGDVIDAGTSIDELIKKIVTKRVQATYTQPSVALSASIAAGSFEVGSTITPTLTAKYIQNDGGELENIKISDGQTDVVVGSTSPLAAESHEVNVVDGDTTFSAIASYGEGQVKNDNLGDASPDGHIAAGSKMSNKITFTGKRKAFYGAGAGEIPAVTSESVRALGGNVLGPIAGTTFSIPISVGQQYVEFAYPATLRDVKEVMYVETNDTGAVSKFTKSDAQVEGLNGYQATAYKVYSYQMAAPAAANMTFKVTI